MSRCALRLLSVALVAMVLFPSAIASAASSTACEKAAGIRAAVIKKHGKRAPGRNICRFGVKHSTGRVEKASFDQKKRYLHALRRMNTSLPYMVPGSPRVPPAGTATPRANLPWCTWGPESGGNYQAVGQGQAAGHYGKYQFDLQTWGSVGGTGNPINASPAEQDKRAAMLYARRGGRPWTNC